MMTQRFYRYILPIKIFCLLLSIFFLRDGFSETEMVSNTSTQTMIVVDREDAGLSDDKESILQHIEAHKRDAFGLISYASGEFTLVLPATSNISILTTYIQSISPAGETHVTPPALPSYIVSNDHASFLIFSTNNDLKKLFADKPLSSLASADTNTYIQ